MALVAALHARIRVDIAWAETSCCACATHCFTAQAFCVLQHFVVELVSCQDLVANVATPRFNVLLALQALGGWVLPASKRALLKSSREMALQGAPE